MCTKVSIIESDQKARDQIGFKNTLCVHLRIYTGQNPQVITGLSSFCARHAQLSLWLQFTRLRVVLTKENEKPEPGRSIRSIYLLEDQLPSDGSGEIPILWSSASVSLRLRSRSESSGVVSLFF